MKVIVNGMKKDIIEPRASFRQIVTLAFGPRHGTYTVSYSKGPRNAAGALAEGQMVDVTAGMVFVVSEATAATVASS